MEDNQTRVVWKYPLSPEQVQRIDLPEGAKVIHVAACPVGGEKVFIWALCDPQRKKKQRTFYVFGTGHEMSEHVAESIERHVGTFFLHDGILVFHVFEAK